MWFPIFYGASSLTYSTSFIYIWDCEQNPNKLSFYFYQKKACKIIFKNIYSIFSSYSEFILNAYKIKNNSKIHKNSKSTYVVMYEDKKIHNTYKHTFRCIHGAYFKGIPTVKNGTNQQLEVIPYYVYGITERYLAILPIVTI